MRMILFSIMFLATSISSAEFRLYLTGGSAGAETFESFIKDADNGHIVVLKASNSASDWYDQNIPKYGHVKSVTTHIILSRAQANEEKIYESLIEADGVFIAGGNQFNYHNWWKGTLIEKALDEQLQKDTPVGGSSAGLAILGEFYFSAHEGGISSDYARKNPMTPYISIESNFLRTPFLKSHDH